jgi:hypothetical protein
MYFSFIQDISRYSPVSQFMSIKFVIFFQFWFGLAVNMLVQNGLLHENQYWSINQFSLLFQSFITSVEMVVASLWHLRAFPVEVFRVSEPEMNAFDAFWDCFHFLDVGQDVQIGYRFLQSWISGNNYSDISTTSRTSSPELESQEPLIANLSLDETREPQPQSSERP